LFKILSYNEANLVDIFVNPTTSKNSINGKTHFGFFKEYFGSSGLNAKSIIVEEQYISKDFFSDFSSYYSLCFKDYPKYCKRLHFFKEVYDKATFQSIIFNKNNNKDFENSYIGFIVVKPIPFTIIGFTLLKNYPFSSKNSSREYFGTREYIIHLFGYKLKIRSLAFQEQDSVLSACATTAIWSTIQKAADLDYQITIKSPYEITKDAGLMSSDGSRLFPNKNGLSILQMCQALTSSGLVVEVRHFRNSLGIYIQGSNSYLKKLVYAYSPIGIPIIIIVNVPNGNSYDLHELAANGYKYSKSKIVPPRSEISWKSDDIEKIYVHDDQVGPFARVEFKSNDTLITNWTINNGDKPTFTSSVLIPVFPKIRLSYDSIEAITIVIDEILSTAFNQIITFDFYWDIRVQFSEDYKNEIRLSTDDNSIKSKIQLKSLPKYIWISSCYVGETIVFDFIFDATEVANSMFLLEIVSYNTSLSSDFKKVLTANIGYVNMFKHANRDLFFDCLINKL